MKKDNKIISFNNCKKGVTNNQAYNKYRLEYSFNIEIHQGSGNEYSFNYFYPEEITEDEFLKIMFEIYLKVARDCKTIKITLKELLNLRLNILYYINVENQKDFKFICSPAIDNSKLLAFLALLIDNY